MTGTYSSKSVGQCSVGPTMDKSGAWYMAQLTAGRFHEAHVRMIAIVFEDLLTKSDDRICYYVL
jgi:hypothetical protein